MTTPVDNASSSLYLGSKFAPLLELENDEVVIAKLEGKVNILLWLFGFRNTVWLTKYRIIQCSKKLFAADFTSLELNKVEQIYSREKNLIIQFIIGLFLLLIGFFGFSDNNRFLFDIGNGFSEIIYFFYMFSFRYDIPINVLSWTYLLIGTWLLLTYRKNHLFINASHNLSKIITDPRQKPDTFINEVIHAIRFHT